MHFIAHGESYNYNIVPIIIIIDTTIIQPEQHKRHEYMELLVLFSVSVMFNLFVSLFSLLTFASKFIPHVLQNLVLFSFVLPQFGHFIEKTPNYILYKFISILL